ncbi:MAG TPA: malto-oligosyltrehalose trehalohydrolase, partial [Cytophagales bacterium]|nr:malto-oligosyltrehalose trehalohydrolase [Cytophagales bacterium]
MTFGSKYAPDKIIFKVWAPLKERMHLHIVHPTDKKVEMNKDEEGYFSVIIEGLPRDTEYYYMPDGDTDYPDPASEFQPKGVHGPSAVVDHSSFAWSDDAWKGKPLQDLILYELHVGTFTPEGTFEAIIPRLDALLEVGINAIELMPVCQFPGTRNWGYDGVYPYAVQESYGGPQGLKKLVNACHHRGIAVFLDVVYNHLGPEGNYFNQFGPYFTEKYSTPWGSALNYDGEYCDPVKEYFTDNPLYWFEHYHIDGLRLDAIHMIFDRDAVTFWELTYNKVKLLEQRLGRPLYMTAESDFNSPAILKTPEIGGYGLDAQWLDDFQHALYVLLDKQGLARYSDYGKMEQLAKAFKEGFVHSGEYVAARKKKYGASSAGIPGNKFIVFTQNHDQVGNRARGERFSLLMNFEQLKIAAAALFLSPYVPMLFMGEEYGEDAPFVYFMDHSDLELIKAVQEGRKKEFEQFNWSQEPLDPQDIQTYELSKIQWEKRTEPKYNTMLQWHKALIKLRNTEAILKNFNKNDVSVNT